MKYILIQSSTQFRILSALKEIPLWSVDLKSCGFACQIHGIRLWTEGESEKKKMRIQK